MMFGSLTPSRLALAAVLCMTVAAGAQTPSFHLVGALPGSNTFSSGYGVSDDGSVVVGHSGNNYYYGSSSHAFRWSLDTGIVDLDPLAPAAGAYGISADGTVIVGGETSGSVKAVRWGGGSSSITDQLYHGGECYGLSRDGSTAIGYSASSGGGGTRPHRAIKYVNSGHLQFIDTPGTGLVDPTTSESLATNTDGSVVVGWGVFNGVQRAFRWTSADNMVALTPSAGIANGVSGDGSIVVGEFSTGTVRHAFRWTAASGLVDLGTLPGMVRSVAYAISTDGSTIIGKSSATAFGGPDRAFIWRADIGMQDLNTVLAASIPAGFTLTEARATNTSGTVLAGGSTTPTGGVEAWVVTTGSCIETSIAKSTASRSTHVGESVDISVSAGGFGPFTYQWRKDAQAITGATGAHLVISPAAMNDAGAYDCVVTGRCGTATSPASVLTVYPTCPADLGQQGGIANGDGVLDNNDFIVFINDFFTGNTQADMGQQGGVAGSDGVLDNNDFIVFIDEFFAGC